MTTETVLADGQLERFAKQYDCHAHGSFKGYARAIEKAAIQSEIVQSWKRDSKRLQFLTAPDSPWFLERNIKNPYQFRMLFNGKPWGVYHLGARGAIDCAMAFHEYQQRI